MANQSSVTIEDVSISNFRSFATVDVERSLPNVKELRAINIFVGPNGAGKSVFFNAIRDCMGHDSFNSQGTYDIKRNFRVTSKPIDVILTLDVSGESAKAVFRRPALTGKGQWRKPTRFTIPKIDFLLKQRVFPIGLPRKFSRFNDLATNAAQCNKTDDSYRRIRQNWGNICKDAKRVGIELTQPPRKPRTRFERTSQDYGDRFFYDILDEKGVSILESSDGIANFLYMIVCIRITPSGSIILIEEPEVNMHPALQKQFLDYVRDLSETYRYQFLISTHSPYLMNLASTDDSIGLYRIFKNKTGHTKIDSLRENKGSEHWQLLKDLGHSPADVMQANGIIWVEGPSDLIYIWSWLEKLAPDLRRGKDYEIMWYGGANFKYMAIGEDSHSDDSLWESETIQDKLIGLFKINPNWAFIVDSDSHNRGISSTTQENKDRFIARCKSLQPPRYTWKVRKYIENCIKKGIMDWNIPLERRKPYWAHKYQEKIRNLDKTGIEGHLTDHARARIQELIHAINTWS